MRESQKIDLSSYRQKDNVEHEGYDEARSIAHGARNNQTILIQVGKQLVERYSSTPGAPLLPTTR